MIVASFTGMLLMQKSGRKKRKGRKERSGIQVTIHPHRNREVAEGHQSHLQKVITGGEEGK